MVLIDKLLKQLYDTGHKVLLFSQMTTMLDILQDFMDFRSVPNYPLALFYLFPINMFFV